MATFALYVCVAPVKARSGAAVSLRAREHRQSVSLHRYVGTLRFFRRHRWLVRFQPTRPVALREVRRARLWVAVLRRELAETRAQLRPVAAMSSALASWYGPGFYGNRTACGVKLTTSLVGVAHKSLACGARLLVCYGGRCSEASVVDRGPYVAGREFDLTGALAWRLGFGGVGVVSWRPL
ncbi:MAG: septal ring lytic transglycosylase RlpA family protein [Gaiellaceae bacterium]